MRPLFTVLALSLSLTLISQEKTGTVWYTWARNRVLEITLTQDTMISRQLGWDFTPRVYARVYRQAIPIDSLVLVQGRLYMFKRKKGTDKKVINYWVPFKDYKNLFSLMADTVDASDPVIKGINITYDTTEIKFPLFVTEPELNRLRSLPSINKMNADDVKRYVNMMTNTRSRMDNNTTADDKLYYGYFIFRYHFAETGYNPFFEEAELEAWIKKFKTNPDTKALVDSLFDDIKEPDDH